MRAPALTLCVCVPQVEGCRASSSTSRRHPRRHLPPEPRCATDTVLHDLARPRTRTRRSLGGRPSPAPNTAPGTSQSAARRAAVGGWAGRWAAGLRQGDWLGSWEGVPGRGGAAGSPAAAPCPCPCTCPPAGVQAGQGTLVGVIAPIIQKSAITAITETQHTRYYSNSAAITA